MTSSDLQLIKPRCRVGPKVLILLSAVVSATERFDVSEIGEHDTKENNADAFREKDRNM